MTNIFIFILDILYILCVCLYIRYDTTAKQSSPHLLIYYCIVFYCTDTENFIFRAVRSRYVMLRYIMLCYVTLRYVAMGCMLYSWISTSALRSVLPFLQNRETDTFLPCRWRQHFLLNSGTFLPNYDALHSRRHVS